MVERYLAAKLAHPGALVLVSAGAFCQALFEDAELLGRELGLRVRDLAADAEPELALVEVQPRFGHAPACPRMEYRRRAVDARQSRRPSPYPSVLVTAACSLLAPGTPPAYRGYPDVAPKTR